MVCRIRREESQNTEVCSESVKWWKMRVCRFPDLRRGGGGGYEARTVKLGAAVILVLLLLRLD